MKLNQADIEKITKFIFLAVAVYGIPAIIKYLFSGIWIFEVVIPLVIFILIGNYLVKYHKFKWENFSKNDIDQDKPKQ